MGRLRSDTSDDPTVRLPPLRRARAAVGLARGRGGLAEFSEEAARDPVLMALRERTVVVADDPAITEAGVQVDVETHDGRHLSKRLAHAIGSVERPLTDEQLNAKFRDQAELILGKVQTSSLLELCWSIDTVDDANSVLEAAVAPA